MLLEDRDLTQRASEIEALLGEIEAFPDPAMRAAALETVQSLLVLYGEGLARMLMIIREEGASPARERILDAFTTDDLVAHLLLLHDLHPVDVETRVLKALEEVRPYLQSHGGNVELVGIDEGVAKLRLQGSCNGCPSSTLTLKLAIEEAIQKAAPDLDRIEAEGAVAPAPAPINFLPASDFIKMKKPSAPAPNWTVVDRMPGLANGGKAATEVEGFPVLFLKIEDSFYAYRNGCPVCGEVLDGGVLKGAELRCAHCGHHYDARRAGRCLDAPDKQLEPIPLLMQDDTIKLALNHF
jgi:Fe-S cluster biogenesis protein NfuA/nitrite reductase/ring-hydroxylating ferredoxin subunit